MKNKTYPVWTMPEWMEKYRDKLVNTGGNDIEDLMNDHDTIVQVNAPRAIICCCVASQVDLLNNLHKLGLLK